MYDVVRVLKVHSHSQVSSRTPVLIIPLFLWCLVSYVSVCLLLSHTSQFFQFLSFVFDLVHIYVLGLSSVGIGVFISPFIKVILL